MGLVGAIVDSFLAFWYILEAILKYMIPRALRKRKDVSDDLVLVTGAGSGLGRLMAIEFAKRDATVVLWDVNTTGNEETEQTIRAFGGKVTSYTVNVINKEEVYEVAAKVKRDVGDVTILVNNAGVVAGKKMMDCPDHLITRTMEVNVTSHFWILKAFLPSMLANNRGHIVTVASLAGFLSANLMVEYCASKFAAVGLHKTLRVELQLDGHDGIDMTLVCPTFISTGMFSGVKATLLTPEYVVSKIMDAVLLNDAMLCVPRYGFLMILLNLIVPEKLILRMQKSSGLAKSMDNFVGRNKNK